MIIPGVQNTVNPAVVGIDLSVLCMEMEDCVLFSQHPDNLRRIHLLPDQVAGIQVRPDLRSHLTAETEQRACVVYTEARMQFQRDLVHAVLLRECRLLLPVWDQHPLPRKDLTEIIRPGTGDPVGHLRSVVRPGATGKGIQD